MGGELLEFSFGKTEGCDALRQHLLLLVVNKKQKKLEWRAGTQRNVKRDPRLSARLAAPDMHARPGCSFEIVVSPRPVAGLVALAALVISRAIFVYVANVVVVRRSSFSGMRFGALSEMRCSLLCFARAPSGVQKILRTPSPSCPGICGQ